MVEPGTPVAERDLGTQLGGDKRIQHAPKQVPHFQDRCYVQLQCRRADHCLGKARLPLWTKHRYHFGPTSSARLEQGQQSYTEIETRAHVYHHILRQYQGARRWQRRSGQARHRMRDVVWDWGSARCGFGQLRRQAVSRDERAMEPALPFHDQLVEGVERYERGRRRIGYWARSIREGVGRKTARP